VDINTARQVGQRLGVKSGLIGIGIAYLITTALMVLFDDSLTDGLLWITRVYWWYHLVIGAIGLLTMAYLSGRLAAVEILIKNKDYSLTGIKYGLLTLWTATIIGSSVGFLQEGLDNIGTADNPFEDYYYKPFFWVTIFGIIPAILVGQWFGRQIKKQGKSISAE
jgi:hypothetical protein